MFRNPFTVLENVVLPTVLYSPAEPPCERAQALLAQTDLTISQVGEAAGFVSSSHFSHIFRKTEGCTPSEYRRLRKTDDEERAEI